MENKKYKDWDSVTIQLELNGVGVVNMQMMRQDLETIAVNNHSVRQDIFELMVAAMEEKIIERNDTIN